MQSQVRIIKPVDRTEKPAMIAHDERQFWVEMRHSLLMQLASIERKLGIPHRRCTGCGGDVDKR
jgi:hypothetical protein